jgi:hypothetical protein
MWIIHKQIEDWSIEVLDVVIIHETMRDSNTFPTETIWLLSAGMIGCRVSSIMWKRGNKYFRTSDCWNVLETMLREVLNVNSQRKSKFCDRRTKISFEWHSTEWQIIIFCERNRRSDDAICYVNGNCRNWRGVGIFVVVRMMVLHLILSLWSD